MNEQQELMGRLHFVLDHTPEYLPIHHELRHLLYYWDKTANLNQLMSCDIKLINSIYNTLMDNFEMDKLCRLFLH